MKISNLIKGMVALAAMIGFAFNANAQSAKVIVDKNGDAIGNYVSETSTTYKGIAQDDFTVPKAGHKVVVFSAQNGQGWLTIKGTGVINVRQSPTTNSPVVTKIRDEYEMYESYECLGKTNGWYKLKANGRIGYVRADLMHWSAIDTF